MRLSYETFGTKGLELSEILDPKYANKPDYIPKPIGYAVTITDSSHCRVLFEKTFFSRHYNNRAKRAAERCLHHWRNELTYKNKDNERYATHYTFSDEERATHNEMCDKLSYAHDKVLLQEGQ